MTSSLCNENKSSCGGMSSKANTALARASLSIGTIFVEKISIPYKIIDYNRNLTDMETHKNTNRAGILD